MKKTVTLFAGALALGWLFGCSSQDPGREGTAVEERPGMLARIDNFRLHDHTGRSHELRRYAGVEAVVLYTVGNGCPIVRRQFDTLRELRERFGEEVVFLLLNGNPQDSREDIVREAEEFSIDFPILRDRAQTVIRSLDIDRTGEAILIDPSTGGIFYRGGVDDRLDYGVTRETASEPSLANALEAFLAGDEIPVATTEVRGCLIYREPAPEEVTYVDDVAPILQRRCIECHQPKHIAPFSFDSYETARGWAPMIGEVIRTKRMPPWHADGEVGKFANDRSLSSEEIRTLLRWVELGGPRGEGPDPLASLEMSPAPDWPLGEPDLVVEIPEVKVPAYGVFDYRYSAVEVPLEEDVWLRAADVQPTNRKVVHHGGVLSVRYPEEFAERQPDFKEGLAGYFAAYFPGTQPWPFPEGTGAFLPAGSSFIIQMHYVATGKPETVRTRIGLYFYEEPPQVELHTRGAYDIDFLIPPGATDHEVTSSHVVERDVQLWGMSPHMHYRGSRFEVEARYPDGSSEVLLTVPHYDFNWQTMYYLETPKILPKGTELFCRGAFDNSPANPANPDPAQEVTFGEQTTEEMFIGYLRYSDVPESE